MAELEIKGTDKYIKYLSKHLIREHPSTKKRMKIKLDGDKKNGKTKDKD